jgi:hypothetical protein
LVIRLMVRKRNTRGKKPQAKIQARPAIQPSRRTQVERNRLSAPQLSHCEQMYARALADPFDPLIQGEVCYPSFPAKKSVKFTGYQTLNCVVGTGGYGYCAFSPTPGNASGGIAYTDATYAGTSASVVTMTAGSGVNTANWVSPTAATDFTESVTGRGNQFRMVVCGAKIRYIGTELNRGGSVAVVTSPQQVTMEGFVLGNNLVPDSSRELIVRSDYQTVVLPPMHEQDVDWKDADEIFPWADAGGTANKPLMVIIVTGTAGNIFTIRLVEHYEVTGASYNLFGTQSHIGNQMVVQSITNAAASAVYGAPTQGKSYIQQFGHALAKIADEPHVRAAAAFVARLGAEVFMSRMSKGAAPRNQLMLTSSGTRRNGYGRTFEDVD